MLDVEFAEGAVEEVEYLVMKLQHIADALDARGLPGCSPLLRASVVVDEALEELRRVADGETP